MPLEGIAVTIGGQLKETTMKRTATVVVLGLTLLAVGKPLVNHWRQVVADQSGGTGGDSSDMMATTAARDVGSWPQGAGQ